MMTREDMKSVLLVRDDKVWHTTQLIPAANSRPSAKQAKASLGSLCMHLHVYQMAMLRFLQGYLALPCYLCGKPGAFGIDAVDQRKPHKDPKAEEGKQLMNSKPCCATDNYAKGGTDALTAVQFTAHCDRVS
jgi:hypothetical protein